MWCPSGEARDAGACLAVRFTAQNGAPWARVPDGRPVRLGRDLKAGPEPEERGRRPAVTGGRKGKFRQAGPEVFPSLAPAWTGWTPDRREKGKFCHGAGKFFLSLGRRATGANLRWFNDFTQLCDLHNRRGRGRALGKTRDSARGAGVVKS